MNELNKKHEHFLLGLKSGYDWQLWVAFQLLKEGFFVQVPTLRLRQRITDENIYTDEGDIAIYIPDKIRKFECKSLSLEFTSNKDFPRNQIIVDMVSNWDKKKHMPMAIINVCRETHGMFAIFTAWNSKKFWVIKDVYDSKKKYHGDFYFIDKNSKFVRSWEFFINWLKSLTEKR